jgi:large subunit ribosomal protein L4
MATVNILDRTGNTAETLDLKPEVFEAPLNESLVHQAVVTELAGMRSGTHKTKGRSEVSGGGRKPYRQKGTGRARQGSTRAPHWRHGGTVHGRTPQDHSLKLNRKMYEGAIRAALTSRVNNGLIVCDTFEVSSGKTKDMVAYLKALGASGKILVVVHDIDEPTILALRNLPNIIDVTTPYELAVYDILNANAVIATKQAVEIITEVYAK